MVISRTLKRLGIGSVFSLAGASHTYLLDALEKDEFAIISNRHETATWPRRMAMRASPESPVSR